MPRKHSCELCGREYSTSEAVFEHIKKDHLGRMSDASVRYLLELGISPNKILKYGATAEQIERVKRGMGQLKLTVFTEVDALDYDPRSEFRMANPSKSSCGV